MVSLSLFRTLLNLNCEDVMLQLVLRYLIPCSHVMLSQKRAVKDLDIYGKSADKFLSLIPRCCRAESLPVPDREEEHATWAKGPTGAPPWTPPPWSPCPSLPRPPVSPSSCASRAAARRRGARRPARPAWPRPAGAPATTPARWEEVAELDGNYLEYLRDAQLGVEQCVRACRVWSAPYDGERPSAASLAPSQPAGPRAPPPRARRRGAWQRRGWGWPGPPAAVSPALAPPRPTSRTQPRSSTGPLGWSRAGPAGQPGGAERAQGRGGERLPHRPGPGPGLGAAVRGLPDRRAAGPGPSEPNGASLSIESFSRELRELEAELQSGAEQPPASSAEPLSQEEEEAYERFASPPERLALAASGGGPGPPGPTRQQPPVCPRTAAQPALHRSLRGRAAGQAGEHGAELAVCERAGDWAGGATGLLPAAPAPLLPAQHQPGFPAQRQVPAAGPGLGEEQDRELRRQAGGLPHPALQARKYLLARGQLDWADTPECRACPAPLGDAGEEPEAVHRGADPAACQQPDAGAAGGPAGPAAGAGGPGGRREAERGAAGEERRVQRRDLQRVPQGAGGHCPGPWGHLALPAGA
ncbi:unnamed protein product [Lepidochelys kempii]